MSCFLCSQGITSSEACGALEFAGDAFDERGRYAVHRECLRPEWRKRWVTREQLLHPEALSVVTPKSDLEQIMWREESRRARQSPVVKVLAQFFAWCLRQCAVEPAVPGIPPYSRRPWRSAPISSHQRVAPSLTCAHEGCEQSPGATGFCMQHQWRETITAEHAFESLRPSVSTLTLDEAVEAMHRHARCCAYDEHFHCAEFICLAQRYLDMHGIMTNLGQPWESWDPHARVNVHNETFFVVKNPQMR